MPGMQTRSQKIKSAPKATARGVIAAERPKKGNSEKGNSEARPIAAPAISAQERATLIARAAYFRAERRGFAPGGELQDWAEAEAEVLRLIGGA